MKASEFALKIKELGIETMAGVPDSALKPFCDYINTDGTGLFRHYVPVNEGAAIGLAIGSYLATGKAACVYMQNSGIGNAVNPITSLANQAVYGIPILLLIGFRGEPGQKDEPQHRFMGRISEEILKVLEIENAVIGKETSYEEFEKELVRAHETINANKQFAFLIKKDFWEREKENIYQNGYGIVREEAIHEIVSVLEDDDILVSTTGKISRELYEQCDLVKGHHSQAFLTVGGMGHASMIALGMANECGEKRVYCLDGDGAVLMHMGNMALIGKQSPRNLIHICLNNDAHESVGGMPTGSVGISYDKIARQCGYSRVCRIEKMQDLKEALRQIKEENQLSFLEIKVRVGSRANLGRPKETAEENKKAFMQYHRERRER